ncbi:MAG: RNA polymerase sigma factor [Clostridia bacterium]|nr:RNA polymerase sigma factor [Clostridia bacterium]
MVNDEGLNLIEKSKKGDAHAFSQLYSMYSNEMYRYALYMTGNQQDAEDSVQEAVISAWRCIHNLKEDDKFKVWLFKILTNKCKTLLIKNNKGHDTLPVEEYDFISAQGDFTVSTELKAALQSLTPPDGQIIILSIIGGFTSEELSQIYNMKPSTIRSRQKRGLERLKAILS